ncbi:AP2-like ethylene-responsive transcription factor BBM [Silene latifolia]|uniref:AP2-like ethylene-responsive transcription factor BBM n=1 Tax=Silene latifolia TaxID=37657 RepID=UPI003D786286
MASMNWLGFSLSPQEIPSQGSNHGGLSGTGECYDLGSDSTAPSSFDILEAFHRSSDNQSQDWNNMKGCSEMSMLMGNQEDEQPKLENFLGNSHSFRDNNNNHQNNGNYMFDINTMTNPNNPNNNYNNNNENSSTTNNNGLNVSMIKSWLRSNHPSQQEVVMMSKNNINNGGNVGGTGAQSLSLSMGTGLHSGVAALPLLATGGGCGGGDSGGDVESSLSENSSSKQQSDSVSNNNTIVATNNNNNVDVQSGALEAVPRKSIETFGQRTSIYRGVTRHRWTGRYEAHLWDNSCRREGQTRKGRQGGYDKEEKAARAYDLAALKYWGTTTTTNFPISEYEKEIEDMKNMTRQEYVASLRRKSSGFSRGASIYRGVTRHHQHGRWQARIGRVAGNKDLYLGTFSTQEEAAEAYDIAAIKFRGLNAVTNFEINRYDVKAILESTNLPIGGAAKRLKEAEQLNSTLDNAHIIRAATIAAQNESNNSSQLALDQNNGLPNYQSWPSIAFHSAQQAQQAQQFTMSYPYGGNTWCKQEQDTSGSTHYQDPTHQVQLNNGTLDFFQMHNLMYGGGTGGPYGPTVVANDENGSGNVNGYENYYYNLGQQGNNNGNVRGAVGTYDQGSACTNWVPTAIPATRGGGIATVVGGPDGGGVPIFTVWNDT